jgi:hypothetical protein
MKTFLSPQSYKKNVPYCFFLLLRKNIFKKPYLCVVDYPHDRKGRHRPYF